MPQTTFINTSDLAGPDWTFLAPISDNPDIRWTVHAGKPRNFIERSIPRPALGRIRAGMTAALAARNDPNAVLVSHLPRMAGMTNMWRNKVCPQTQHIAFAFNFTDLPVGAARKRLAGQFDSIDKFVVFSRFEIARYADYFDIDPAKIQFLPWAMDPPTIGPDNPVAGKGPYACAIGGEGRDYAILAKAMRALPHHRLVIVARPHSIAGIDFPDNVTVLTNLPSPQTWRIAADSLGLAIPLKTENTACGHVTMIGAKLLGLPLIVTRSQGVVDYVSAEDAVIVEPQDTDNMIDALKMLYQEPDKAKELGQVGQRKALRDNDTSVWLRYFEQIHNQRHGMDT